jgi:hypothetical protein
MSSESTIKFKILIDPGKYPIFTTPVELLQGRFNVSVEPDRYSRDAAKEKLSKPLTDL